MKNKGKNHGFTLVELIISIAISSIVIATAFALVLMATRSYEESNLDSNISSESQSTINIIGNAIMQGKQSEVAITPPADPTVTNVLDTGNQILVYNDTDNSLYIYSDAEGVNPGDEQHLISDHVSSFVAVFNDNDGTVTVTMTIQIGSKSVDFVNTFDIRNS